MTSVATITGMAGTVNGQEPRRRSPIRRVLVILLVVLVVCCAGGLAALYGLVHLVNGQTAAARGTADRYLSDLEAGRPADAYQLTCPDFRSHIDQATFVKVEHDTPQPRSHRITDTSVSTVNGQRSALVTVELTMPDGGRTRESIPLGVIGGTWYVCSVQPLP